MDDEQNILSDEAMLDLTSDIVSAFVSNNPLPATALPDLIRSVHETLADLNAAEPVAPPRPDPAVAISKSITPDYLICLEDGRKLKMLKRYLRSRYDMTPDEYRSRWNLPSDYPMVAPNYAKKRSEFAKEIGLGRKAGAKT
ncbi:MAG: MucR family transcriptional regulator [Hyphomonadaceae bacterium]|nr:MucR family transcriptional regulator [Hyphomonadaceae bacterium]